MRRSALIGGIALVALVAGVAVQVVGPSFFFALLTASALAVLIYKSLRGFLWFSLAFRPIIEISYGQILGSGALGVFTVPRILAVVAPTLGTVMLFQARVDILSFPVAAPLLSFVLVNLLGAALSIDQVEGVQIFFRVVGPLVFYFAASQILRSDAEIRKFIRTLLFVLVVPYVWALLQLVGILPKPIVEITGTLEGIRIMGPYSDAWSIAAYPFMSGPLSLVEITETEGAERCVPPQAVASPRTMP